MGTLDELTPTVLRQLYEDEGWTETAIAERFGTYQVKVGRLRRRFGIPTITKSDRLGLPELTPRLQSILVGSMLGDGSLQRTGSQTARYLEHHSIEQRAYLDWKVQEWGPFASSVSPSDKGVYRGFRLITHGCRTLLPFWELFYPKGKGAKTFTKLSLEWVDELALAVWLMDDGSKTGRYLRLSVGPNKADQKAQLAVLRHWGVRGKLYGEDDDAAIHVQGRKDIDRFIELVSPHIHPSMSYKLELQPAQAGPAPRDILTPERLSPLIDRGFTAGAMAEVFQVSRQSVSRALSRMGLAVPRGRPRKDAKKELDVGSAEFALKRLDPDSTTFEAEALAVLRQTEFPFVVPSEEQVQQDWVKLQKAKTCLEGNTIVGLTFAGSKLCQRFFQYRLDARYRHYPSVREAWYDHDRLRQAIRFQVSVGDPVTVPRVFRAVKAVVRGPTNFRPCYAKALTEAFSPEGGLVLDPCAGYGGRAVGVVAAGRRYLGVDPHPQAGEAFQGLQEVTGALGFHNQPFEDVDLGDIQADLVFTSPPYYSVERYSDDPAQSWVRYRSWQAWVEGFLQTLVSKSRAALKPGGVFCVNTKNVKMGRRELPIADEVVRLAREGGFELKQTLELPLGRIGKVAQTEPIFVFR